MKRAVCVLATMNMMHGALAAEREKVMLVLDASGSMWGQIDSRNKVEIAREAVADLVGHWKPDVDLGLVAYGHRRKGDCADIETVLNAGPLDAKTYLAKVNGLSAKGMTPLSQAVIHAADALKASEAKATVILISDGEETCNLDPCTVGKQLEAKGVDFTAHVIGFDVPNPAHQAQLRCLAENTGGRYFNASDAASLEKALGQVAVVSTEKPLPAVPAKLMPPAKIVAGTDIRIGFEGPGETRDWIGIAKIGSQDDAYLNYEWVRTAKGEVTLRTPAAPGDYELRYVSAKRTPPILARTKVTISAALATITGPKSVMAGDMVTVEATGPTEQQHWIGIAPKGTGASEYRDYVRPDTSGKTRATLKTPSKPGDYEFRYVLNEWEKVAASQPFVVLPAEARFISAPEHAAKQSQIEVEWAGPRGNGHWIGIIRRGGGADAYLTYQYAQDSYPKARFDTPDEAGDYDLVFVLSGENGEQVILRQPLRVD